MRGVRAVGGNGAVARPPASSSADGWAGLRSVGEAGKMLALAGRTARAAVAPPYVRWRDALVELSFAVRRALAPLAISVITFTVGAGVIVLGQLLLVLGTADRYGGGITVGILREIGIWVTSMIFAGVAGSAICADLGARKIREELDALDVLGVDGERALVVPRVVALVVAGPVLGLIGFLIAIVANYFAALLVLAVPGAVFLETQGTFLTAADTLAFVVKLALIGAFIAIVACHKGLTVQGGPEGVGRAVNQTVMITFLGVWIFNTLFNAIFFAAFPEALALRG